MFHLPTELLEKCDCVRIRVRLFAPNMVFSSSYVTISDPDPPGGSGTEQIASGTVLINTTRAIIGVGVIVSGGFLLVFCCSNHID